MIKNLISPMVFFVLGFGLLVVVFCNDARAVESVSTKRKQKTEQKTAPKPTTEESAVEQAEALEVLLRYTNDQLSLLRSKNKNCPDCYVTYAGDGDAPNTDPISNKANCDAKWKAFYNKGPGQPIDIRIVFGYFDQDIQIDYTDHLVREKMVKFVTEACDGGNMSLVRVCGFRQSLHDEDIFEKEVLGPTGKMQLVRLQLATSSYSPSDRVNRSFVQEQVKHTAKTEKVFYDGIVESDMLLYIGHARGGGGPDFAPAERRANGTIDYTKYQTTKPGLNRLASTLKSSKKTPKIMGFFACNSERWRSELESFAPNSGLLLSSDATSPIEAALGFAYLALDSVLWQRCETEFNLAMNRLKNAYSKPLMPLRLNRFFKTDD